MQDLTPDPSTLDPIETASRDELARPAARAPAVDPAARLRRTCRTTGRRSTPPASTPTTAASLADLARFPFTTKQDLRDNYPFGMFAVPREQVVARRTPRRARPASPPSSATPTNDIDTWADLMARSIRAAGGRPGDVVHVAYGYGLFTGGLGAHYGAERLGCTVVPCRGGMTERQVS